MSFTGSPWVTILPPTVKPLKAPLKVFYYYYFDMNSSCKEDCELEVEGCGAEQTVGRTQRQHKE